MSEHQFFPTKLVSGNPTTMVPAVAIVIVNWNKKNDVINLLSSLQTIAYESFDVILVDNASTDGSIDAVNLQFPDVTIIQNTKNLGGTGGFNSGLRHALIQGDYKYIWLLDNDAEPDNNALAELVRAMEDDPGIGIAGSRIADNARRDVTIEAGSFFRWDTIEVKPLFRNEKNIDTTDTIRNVDYVAICSALIRKSALEKVGLMDERYFLFWDDMDWGLQFKKHDFKIVAVLTSVAYHPPFTEKRSAIVDFYYGNRNPLLTYAKHAKPAGRLAIYFKHLRYRSKVLFFLGLSGRKDLMEMGLRGIYDFVSGRWGGKNFQTVCQKKAEPVRFPDVVRSIIILNTGNRDEIYGAFHELKKIYPDAKYSLLIQDDRSGLFQTEFDDTFELKRDKQENLLYLLGSFFRILRKNYDMAIIPSYPSPFSFAVKKAYLYSSGNFSESNGNRRNLWKVVLSTFLGEAVSALLLPLVYMRSLTYVTDPLSCGTENESKNLEEV